MKHILVILSLLLLSSPLFGQEYGVLYQYETSSGIQWKTFGDGKVRPKYEGEIRNAKPDGFGILIWFDGRKYVGNFKDGKMDGQGMFIFSSGDKYEGEFKEGKKHGHGTYTFHEGSKYEGEYKDGEYHGQGTFTFTDGSKYEGEWKDGKPWNLTIYDKNGNIIGKWVNGVRQ